MLSRSEDLKLKRKCAALTLKWCKKILGKNPRRKIPPRVTVRIYFRKDETYKKTKGAYYYDDNIIVIYYLNNKNIKELISTIIHEYTHYLQPDKQYWEYFQTHYYSTHPHERQADRYATKYLTQCLKEIKPLLS